jgi:hypothetical protein
MDKELIIHWAIKAHMEASAADDNCRVPHFDDVTLEELEAFANLVAAHEREAIALLIEKRGMQGYGTLAIAAEVRIKGGVQ